MTVSQSGFSTSTSNIELTLNRVATFNIQLQVGNAVAEVVNVNENVLPLLEPNASSTGLTVTPQQIQDLPVNGRNYLDLLQLVPGVAINRQADPASDTATPVLGERGGNNNFFIDGHSNKDTVNGGPAAQFNQETIAEFQVLTTGYKVEFGQASGAIVNVITKSGGNGFHGVGSLFHRNEAFDSSNSLDSTRTDAPTLRRFDYSLALGGPVIKDKVFFFASSERITERRQLDFSFPDTGSPVVNQLLRNQESLFDNSSRSFETRNFLKFDEQLGRHHLTQQVNYTNRVVREFLPLSASGSLPSTRNDSGQRHLLLGFGDTVLLGEQGNPWVVTLRGAYRGEPTDSRPSHPDAGAATRFFPFSSNATGTLFGDFPTVSFGNPITASNLDQKYTSLSAHAAKLLGDHDVKFGWNFLRTKVDGVREQSLGTQLFATAADFATFGPINAGFFTVTTAGGLTPEANEIHPWNNYNGLFAQDDWKLRSNLTLNLGLRWDYDSEFKIKRNFSPRLGVAWALTPKTVVRGHFGVFYDQYRLGLVADVPSFGGADRRIVQPFSYPRGFYGVPSLVAALVNSSLFPPNGLCVSPNLTDAQITASGAACPFGGLFVGIDRLNGVVAPGHALIPANAVINLSNVQALTGLTPDQYAAQASAAVGRPAGFFFFGPFGALSHAALPPQLLPTSIDESFETPHTLSFSVGVQRQIGKDMVVEADYYHRDISNILGVRQSNLRFQSRVTGRSFSPPFTQGSISTFGPWYEGTYDALVVNFNKRFSRRFLLGANYTFAHATDNQLGIGALPSDSFIGIVPEVTEPGTGRTNRDGSFIAPAGYIVERVSGRPFNEYVEENIFKPLGMTHSTFVQPLPVALAPNMSNGYQLASDEPKPFEVVIPFPAGSLSSTATDMARFIIAHLQDGQLGDARILRPETARLMHSSLFALDPAANAMAYGFYEESRNRHRIIGHAGDTVYFHSDLHLITGAGVGFFVSYNSAGKGQISPRTILWEAFLDRYFPYTPSSAPTLDSAKEDAKAVSGTYIISRRSETSFLKAAGLIGEATVSAAEDGTIEVSAFSEPTGKPKRWQEVAPMTFRDVNGQETLIFKRDRNGSMEMILPFPFFTFQRVGLWENKRLLLPVVGISLLIMLLTLLLSPVAWLVRRHYGHKLELTPMERRLRLSVWIVFALDLFFVAALTGLVVYASTHIEFLSDRGNTWFHLAQVIGVLGAIGTLVVLYNAIHAWMSKRSRIWGKLQATILALACLGFLWFAFAGNLLHFSSNY